jgi:dCMP deaminase
MRKWPETGCERDSRGSCSLALHAEQNALMYAFSNNAKVDGSTIYLTLTPCLACARMLLSAGIKKVVYLKSYAEYKGLPKDEGIDFLQKFGVETSKFGEDVLIPDELI